MLALPGSAAAVGPLTFAPKVDYLTGAVPVSVAAAHLDGDGVLDLATANANMVSVLLNDTDATGPVVSGVSVAPNSVISGIAAALTATASEATTGGAKVASASYTVDGDTATTMSAVDGTFDSATEMLTAPIATNTLGPGPGADRLDGQSGNDVIRGNGGNDLIAGGAGNDWVNGGTGQDTITGGKWTGPSLWRRWP